MPGKIAISILFALALIVVLNAAQAAAAQGTGTEVNHLVQPGDTWQALAWRYGVQVESIKAAYPHPNPHNQPAIGQVVVVPLSNQDQQAGIIANANDGGLLQLSAANGIHPWRAAISNELSNPYRPLLYRTVFLETGSEPPKQLPAGMLSLEVSQAPGRPGQALAVRGATVGIEPITARFAGNEFHIANNGPRFIGLVGTGAFSEPGHYLLELSVAGQPLWSQPWLLSPGEWTFEEITYTGSAATIDAESIRQERERLATIWTQVSDRPSWSGSFAEPLESYLAISSRYGARRSYGGGPYDRYHEGLDFSAYGGSPVHAPAAGVVVLAEELIARGGAVLIDHGLGVFTGYYHLSEVLAEPGTAVTAGDNIGLVGSTGLSTGNHLHWDLLVAGTWVDPAAWLGQDMACWLLEGWGAPCSS